MIGRPAMEVDCYIKVGVLGDGDIKITKLKRLSSKS